jgi:hypothetical protein
MEEMFGGLREDLEAGFTKKVKKEVTAVAKQCTWMTEKAIQALVKKEVLKERGKWNGQGHGGVKRDEEMQQLREEFRAQMAAQSKAWEQKYEMFEHRHAEDIKDVKEQSTLKNANLGNEALKGERAFALDMVKALRESKVG